MDHSDMSGMDSMSSTSGAMAGMKMYFHGSIGSDILWFASWVPSSPGATVGVCLGVFVIALFERYLAAVRRACDTAWQRGQVGFIAPSSVGSFIIPPTLARQSPHIFNHLPTSSSSTTSDEITPITLHRSGQISPTASQTGRDEEKGDIFDVRPHGSYGETNDVPADSTEMNEMAHLPPAVRIAIMAERRGKWSRPWRAGVDIPRGILQALQTLIHYLLMLVAMSFNVWWILAVVVGSGAGEMVFGRFGAGAGDTNH